MRPWQFRQKTPGFGISKDFYITVLAATAHLPSILEVVEPHGALGAIEGFGVPLSRDKQKEDLAHPMERGVYGIATRNRETVLRLVVIPKEEAGFDPAPFLRSAEAQGLTPEHLNRIGATWTLLQITFESHEAMVFGSLEFLLRVGRRLAELTEGVVSDPISRVYLLPTEVIIGNANDSRNFVRVWHKPEQNGWMYTLGMQKFGMPEFELFGVPAAYFASAQALLLGVAQAGLNGKLPVVGSLVASRQCPLQVAEGGLNRGNWEGIKCDELIPPSGHTVVEALDAWASERDAASKSV